MGKIKWDVTGTELAWHEYQWWRNDAINGVGNDDDDDKNQGI